MWYSQYGRLWSGPWFVNGEVTTIAAGIIGLDNVPAGWLTMGDYANGRVDVADR